MSTKAVVKAWYNAGGQYIYWNTSQISNPLSEYPTGSPGYPATNLLSDFVLFDYEGESVDFNGSILEGTWDGGVSDGYAVYLDSTTGNITLGMANSYLTSRILGVAYSDADKTVLSGEYDVFCDGAVDDGVPVFLSATTAGAVTALAPRTAGQVQVIVGTTTEAKASLDLDTVKVAIKPDEPLELEETIEI